MPLCGRHQLRGCGWGRRGVAAAGGAVGCLPGLEQAGGQLAAAAIHGCQSCQADNVTKRCTAEPPPLRRCRQRATAHAPAAPAAAAIKVAASGPTTGLPHALLLLLLLWLPLSEAWSPPPPPPPPPLAAVDCTSTPSGAAFPTTPCCRGASSECSCRRERGVRGASSCLGGDIWPV